MKRNENMPKPIFAQNNWNLNELVARRHRKTTPTIIMIRSKVALVFRQNSNELREQQQKKLHNWFKCEKNYQLNAEKISVIKSLRSFQFVSSKLYSTLLNTFVFSAYFSTVFIFSIESIWNRASLLVFNFFYGVATWENRLANKSKEFQ